MKLFMVLLIHAALFWSRTVGVLSSSVIKTAQLINAILCRPSYAVQRWSRGWCAKHYYEYAAMAGVKTEWDHAEQKMYEEQFQKAKHLSVVDRINGFKQYEERQQSQKGLIKDGQAFCD